jgi:hypothetical protein
MAAHLRYLRQLTRGRMAPVLMRQCDDARPLLRSARRLLRCAWHIACLRQLSRQLQTHETHTIGGAEADAN